ncbi:extracellular solute-binding protein [Paenibacillus albiflavus]|uniref:Extracellular solute-binding protein n=1 Tax=Paenibacillus albiflavus TaxID=2545760 RepID=A0A4R4EEK8_9BACL|nr:extracellular solute-binding protein [Paenibacillus albiflavus]TCZ77683.1 extracellular solute-binding protein [Paenibacillus albiflavus]
MLRRVNDFQERYEKCLNELRDEIVSCEIQPGEFILSENTLSRKYEISRVSLRKALAQLVDEGLIEKIPGKGNRVKLPSEEQAVTLELAWFSNSYEIDIVRKIIHKFEKKYPFVKVKLTLLPGDGYTNSLIQLIEQSRGPDVFMVSDWHFRQFKDAGKTNLFANYIPSHLNAQDTSYPQAFELFTLEGRTRVAPFLISPVVICYNKAIFEENGISDNTPLDHWDDLLEVAKRCTRDLNGDGTIDQYGFCFSSSYNRWTAFLLQNLGQIMEPDRSRSTMSNQATIEALEYCVSLMYKDRVSPIYSHGSNFLAEGLFMKQRVAMILTTYYFMNEFRNHSISWDVLPVPGGKTRATLLLGGGLALNRDSAKHKLAQKLIDFMTDTEAQTLLKQYGCTIPALKSVAEDDSLLDPSIHPEHYHRFLEVLPYAKPLSHLHLTESEVEQLYDELTLLWANMESPEDACQRIEQIFNEQLNKKAKA